MTEKPESLGAGLPSDLTSLAPQQVLALVTRYLESQHALKAKPAPDAARTLRELLASYQKSHTFKVGDLVRWKKGLKTRVYPQGEDAAIVVEVLSTPLIDPATDPAVPHFKNAYDLVCGVIFEGNFYTYYFSSNRLELYPEINE